MKKILMMVAIMPQALIASRLPFLQEADDGIADAGEAEVGWIDLVDGYPAGFGRIVGGGYGDGVAVYGDQEVHVEGMDAHAAIGVDVR